MNELLTKPRSCASCNRTRVLQWSFCPFCLELDSGRACPECRRRLDPDWKHCPGCGYTTSLAEPDEDLPQKTLSDSTEPIAEEDTETPGAPEPEVAEPDVRQTAVADSDEREPPAEAGHAFREIPPAVDLTDPRVRQYVQAFLRLLADGKLAVVEARQYMDAFAPTEYSDIDQTNLWDKLSIQRYFAAWGLMFDGDSFNYRPCKPVSFDPWPRQIESQLNKLMYGLTNNPLETLGVRWANPGTIDWKRISVSTDKLSFSAKPRTVRLTGRAPDNHWEAPGASVTLMEVRVFQWGTVAALRIHNSGGADHSIDTSWVKDGERRASKIRLRDLESSRTYWPIDSNLGGNVSRGAPDVRLVAFEPLQQPTRAICIEAHDVQLSKGTGQKDAFSLQVEGNDVWRATQVSLRDAPATVELEHSLIRHRKLLG